MRIALGGAIEWILFDMDGTLCDLDQAMAAGLHAVNDLVAPLIGADADAPPPEEYQEAWRALADRHLAEGMTYEEIRRGSIREVLARRGIRLSGAQEQEVLDAFFRVRFASTALFDDVRDVLSAL